MTTISKSFLDLSDKARSQADADAERFFRRWQLLCERYLPIEFEDSVWRYNRESRPQEPSQGWKLHISATILDACDLLEKVAPFLIFEDVQFKAPKSLNELSILNCGLQYGYHQVGKFITVYPSTEEKAVELARHIHELTKDFSAVSVPFDEQYAPDSSVFYRYGALSHIESIDENGKAFPSIIDHSGKTVLDDRLRAVPEWISDPFPKNKDLFQKTFTDTPLGTTYRIFRAIKQRGKGGIYEAFDFSQNKPRLCIIKEGRKNGEIGWSGQDGYFLVANEFEVLSVLKEQYAAVPQVYSSFEIHGNFYFAMEYVGGKSLKEIMRFRRRRFSVRKVIELAIEIAKIIENIHQAGWIWNDCKPANLLVTNDKSLRPIDFEGAYPANQSEPFDWKTEGFSKVAENSENSGGKSADLYSLGAVIYFLLTGIFYDGDKPVKIKKLRPNVPRKLVELIENLLSASDPDISAAGKEFEKILKKL